MNLAEFIEQVREGARRRAMDLPAGIETSLFDYVELLRRWNATINLTSLPLDPLTPETIDRLLLEPLQAAGTLSSARGPWFDLGSGGGSPAIPIKLALPQLALTMVESRERKAAFLRETIRALGLSAAAVENVRFEALRDRAELAGSAGLITVRAVRLDAEFVELCAALLRDGGLLAPIGFAGLALPGFAHDASTGFFRRECST